MSWVYSIVGGNCKAKRSKEMKIQKQINIIGGGIAGLTTALTLQNKGIDFRLFEKSGQITYENVGFGINK